MKSLFLLTTVLLLSACATTGDPTTGGLFGWSESKAIARQQELQQQSQAIDRQNDEISLANAALNEKRLAIDNEIKAASAYAARLLAKNDALERRVSELQRSGSLRQDQLQALRAQHTVTLKSRNALEDFYGKSNNRATDEELAQSLERENDRLSREIQLLLDR